MRTSPLAQGTGQPVRDKREPPHRYRRSEAPANKESLMTENTIDEDHYWGCHKSMTSEEYADHHTHHDDVCCQDETRSR